MRYRARMKAKKAKAVQKLFEQTEISKIPSHSPIKSKHPEIDYTSFVSSKICYGSQITNKQTNYGCSYNATHMGTEV